MKSFPPDSVISTEFIIPEFIPRKSKGYFPPGKFKGNQLQDYPQDLLEVSRELMAHVAERGQSVSF